PACAWIARVESGGRDLGPLALWLLGGVFALCAAFVAAFYKELKLTTFDAPLAAALGFAPVALNYALMALVSVVAVGAFDVVGSVLVIALMIAPPAAAWLLTDRLDRLIALSVLFGVGSAIGGYWIARGLDASIAGAMAGASGVLFAFAFAFAPDRGLLAQALRRRRQRATFAERMLLVHLLHHEKTPEAERECRVSHLSDHLRWEPARAQLAVRTAEREGAVTRAGDRLALTSSGRERARQAMVE
ncbi:MAG: metal ABC transporter permease, partial [Bacteroidota bacterium]